MEQSTQLLSLSKTVIFRQLLKKKRKDLGALILPQCMGSTRIYCYRTNYFIMIVAILALGFLRRPLAIVAALLTTLSIAFRNDSFAGTFSEKVTRTVRQFSPHLAAKMRLPFTPVIRGRPSAKRAIFICGRPLWVFVLVFSLASFFLWFASCGLLTVLWALSTGLLSTLLHASFRTPNLKALLTHSVKNFELSGATIVSCSFHGVPFRGRQLWKPSTLH